MKILSSTLLLSAAAMVLTACGGESEPEQVAEPDFSDDAAAELAALEQRNSGPTPGDWNETLQRDARLVFAQMCGARSVDPVVCECMMTRMERQLGTDAVFATAVAYGQRADLAVEVSRRVTDSERLQSASAFLNLQRQCRNEALEREEESQ